MFSENHMACYVLSYSKVIMNNFILKMDAHKESKIYYMDTDSMYIHVNDFEKYLSDV
jgi:ABC-type enterochelin transport system substrate-binding protein